LKKNRNYVVVVTRDRPLTSKFPVMVTVRFSGKNGSSSPTAKISPRGKGVSGPGTTATPEIKFTRVPPCGSTNNLIGQVRFVNPADFRVAVYIKVYNGWWTKPYWTTPLTAIRKDGTWQTDIVTGGRDQIATEIRAFLVPNTYAPKKVAGDRALPRDLYRSAVAWAKVSRHCE
jgi:hypothetical protein